MGELFTDALRLYRASFARCWVLGLIGAVLNAVASAYQAKSLSALTALSPADLSTLSPDDMVQTLTTRIDLVLHSRTLWLSTWSVLLVWLVICAALITRQHAAAVGRDDSIGESLALGLRRLPGTLAASILWALLTLIGLLLLIIPGLWIGGMLQLWFVPLCIEARGPVGALGRSWQLVERHWWYASTVLGVAMTLIAFLSLAAELMTGGLGATSTGTTVVSPLSSQLLSGVITFVSMPLLTVVMLSLYYDLELRRKAGDRARV